MFLNHAQFYTMLQWTGASSCRQWSVYGRLVKMVARMEEGKA